MTTLKQRLVRKKNRKLRRLRELYPDIRIKLFYARDFRAMMLKYGRLGLAESLSGTPGQVVPDRPASVGAAPGLLEVVADSAGASRSEPSVEAGIGTPVAAERARTNRRRRAAGATAGGATPATTTAASSGSRVQHEAGA